MEVTVQQQTYLCFADLLDYPQPDLPAQAHTCARLLASDFPEASGQIQGFAERASGTSQGRLEEIYTGTFDVNPACYIFAGYMLFGEGFNRGKFLVRLQEKYRQHDFSQGNELADHVAVIFRFLGILEPDDPTVQVLIEDCLTPVITKMNAGFKNDSANPNPYQQVLLAIQSVLERTQEAIPVN
jgi:nitrate reductase delta subunit